MLGINKELKFNRRLENPLGEIGAWFTVRDQSSTATQLNGKIVRQPPDNHEAYPGSQVGEGRSGMSYTQDDLYVLAPGSHEAMNPYTIPPIMPVNTIRWMRRLMEGWERVISDILSSFGCRVVHGYSGYIYLEHIG